MKRNAKQKGCFSRMTQDLYRARYKTVREIRRHGAVGSLQEGPMIRMHGIPTRLIAWPGNGYQTESVHVLTLQSGEGRRDSYASDLG
jgi:hypothetical protein